MPAQGTVLALGYGVLTEAESWLHTSDIDSLTATAITREPNIRPTSSALQWREPLDTPRERFRRNRRQSASTL